MSAATTGANMSLFHVSFDDNQGVFEEGLKLFTQALGG